MTRMQQMNRESLFHWINMVSFAVNDITLYLDTHPDDREAIEYFNHVKELRKDALKEYNSRFGPLTVDCATPENTWLWSTQPMPWEGGCK